MEYTTDEQINSDQKDELKYELFFRNHYTEWSGIMIIFVKTISIMKIDHIALYCRDLKAMKEFFEEYFQGTSNDQYHNPRTNLRTYILTFPDSPARLELMTRPEVCGDNENQFSAGFIHLSFAVGSKEAVDELTAKLAENGYATLSGPRTTGDGYYESCVKGPEGILLEITV